PFGQSVTFTATVTSGGGTPNSGTVTFFDNGSPLTTVNVNGSGVSTFTTSTLSVTNHPLTATYNGSASFSASNSNTVNQNVTAAGTTTIASGPAGSVTQGQVAALTATVSSSGGTPTGTVNFMEGPTTVSTGTRRRGT